MISDTLIMGALAFLGALIVVIRPIINLNTSIVELNATLKEFKNNHEKLETRVTKHGEKIDDLEKVTTAHDVRITAMEKGGK